MIPLVRAAFAAFQKAPTETKTGFMQALRNSPVLSSILASGGITAVFAAAEADAATGDGSVLSELTAIAKSAGVVAADFADSAIDAVGTAVGMDMASNVTANEVSEVIAMRTLYNYLRQNYMTAEAAIREREAQAAFMSMSDEDIRNLFKAFG